MNKVVVEEELLLGLSRGDKRLQARFFDAISDEWRPKLRRLLQRPSAEEVDDLLHDALIALCLPTPERPRPRVLAPPEAKSPEGWRSRVLKNFVTDRLRHRGLRTHVEAYAGRGVEKEVAQEAWRRRKSGGEAEAPPAPAEAPVVQTEGAMLDLITLRSQRAQVMALAEQLVIRRRMILLLAIDADPSPFAEELGRALKEAVEATLARIELALQSPVEEPPSLPRVRVPWPVEPEDKARESARKALERAVESLRDALRRREEAP